LFLLFNFLQHSLSESPAHNLATQAGWKLGKKMAVDFVGIGEAAQILGLSRTSVQKLVDSGQLPAVKTNGGHRRILRSSIDALDQKMGPKAMLRLATINRGNRTPNQSNRRALSQQVNVLIVEDDEVSALALIGMFENHYPQVHCTIANDGLDAVMQLERIRPNLLITDLNMEPFDGFRLLNMMGSHAEYCSISTLVLSGLSMEDIERRGGLPPGVLFFPKPINMERMRGFLDAHVQIHLKQGLSE
jgi:excisionase family DNA binding protein